MPLINSSKSNLSCFRLKYLFFYFNVKHCNMLCGWQAKHTVRQSGKFLSQNSINFQIQTFFLLSISQSREFSLKFFWLLKSLKKINENSGEYQWVFFHLFFLNQLNLSLIHVFQSFDLQWKVMKLNFAYTFGKFQWKTGKYNWWKTDRKNLPFMINWVNNSRHSTL
jgi:hypothetical protein